MDEITADESEPTGYNNVLQSRFESVNSSRSLKKLLSNIPDELERLLVIGSAGLVGSRVAAKANRYGFEPYNTQRTRKSPFPNSVDLDITNHDATLELVKRVRPSTIVNTAAVTNVDYCETNRDEARRVNVDGVKNLAEAAQANGCKLVQISTDFVFDGTFGHYTELDTPNPIQYYGQTKLESEKVASEVPSYAIVRPSVIYGWTSLEAEKATSDSGKPLNFAMFLLDRLRRQETVKAVRDQYSSPTFADNLADSILLLARHHGNGIFHTAGRSCVSRYEFATRLAEVFGQPKNLIQPVFSSEFKQVAARPKNSCLNINRAEKVLGIKFQTVEEGAMEMKKQSTASVSHPG